MQFYQQHISLIAFKKMADKEKEEKTIAEDLVVTKYKLAGEIVNRKLYFFFLFSYKNKEKQ